MITIGFQSWHAAFNWYVPNTINPLFSGKTLNDTPATHGFMYWNTSMIDHPTSDTDLSMFSPDTRETLMNHPQIKHSLIKDIPDGKYIFPVFIRSLWYFNEHEHVGFDLIDAAIMSDIRNGRARLVLCMPYEGTSGVSVWNRDFKILDSWCKKHGLGKEHVYYITGNHRITELCAEMDFTPIPVDTFISWIPYMTQTPVSYKPVGPKNLFLTYNRRVRYHRALLLTLLYRDDLIKDGLVSYGGSNYQNTTKSLIKTYKNRDLDEYAKQVDSLGPLELDVDLTLNNPASFITPSHHEETMLSVISETLSDNESIFLSEKTWKSISLGHPFMILGNPQTLSTLRKMGYRTFDVFFNESYDTIYDTRDRTELIVSELKRLSNLSLNDRIALRHRMNDITTHNQLLFNSVYQKNIKGGPDHPVFEAFELIWERMHA